MTASFAGLVQPPAVLNMGPTGTGKSDSLATILEAGLELFVLITEPDGLGSLLDSCARRKIPIDKLHWSTCLPAPPGWSALDEMADTIGKMGFEQIQGIKSGVGKNDTRVPAMKLLAQLRNFHCERTDRGYGPVDKWSSSTALALDSLSGLNIISWMLTIGYKPAAHQGEWGVAMNFIEQLLLKITADRQYFFVLNAHVEREVNELTGMTQTMTSTLGRKLAPKLSRFFSEVIISKKIVDKGNSKFLWSNMDAQCDLKNRSLPLSDQLPQTYVPIVEAYNKRMAFAGVTPPTPGVQPVV